jgi:TonB family protein
MKTSRAILLIAIALAGANGQLTPANSAPNSKIEPSPDSLNKNLTKQIEILTDTMGVNFSPYLKDSILPKIRSSWIGLVPDEARAPIMKPGRVVIEFFIYQDGSVRDMELVSSSADVALDRAAWAAIVAFSPLEPLPLKFTGPKLGLRINFYYNADPDSDSRDRNGAVHAGEQVIAPILIHTKTANYPKSARKLGHQGTVVLSLIVGTDGKPRSVVATKGVEPDLDEQAVKAVQKWRFRPGTLGGKPVAVVVSEEVTFKLN